MRSQVASSAGSLVVFTVLAQAAAGAACLRVVLPWLLPQRLPVETVDALVDPLLPVAAGLLVVSGLAAWLHLARPRAARFATAHLGSSWLSREIALGALFGAVLLADLILRALGTGLDVFRWPAALLGLALVVSISAVYRLRTVPAWDTPATPFAFFATTVLLGTTAAAAVLVLSGGPRDLVDPGLRALGLLAACTAAAQVLGLVLHLRALTRRGGVAAESARVVQQTRGGLLALRVGTAAVGSILLIGTTWPLHGTEARVPILFACALLLLSELIGRTLFYATHRRVGL